MDPNDTIAGGLASAFLGGEFDVDGLVARGRQLLGRNWRWLRPLARRVVVAFPSGTRPRHATVAKFILADRGFLRAYEKHDVCLVNLVFASDSQMRPVAAAVAWPVVALDSVQELADWLDVTLGELAWFADTRSLEYKQNAGALLHYRYRWLSKRFGQLRLIEAPKPRLKQIQRRILTDILDHVPPHDAAHGFRPGRSIKTFTAPHAAQRVVLKIDLQDFFPSIALARVQAIFRTVGYAEEIADLLAGLCTNAAPAAPWSDAGELSVGDSRQFRRMRWRYSQTHLPQGAPTSPALANLAAYRLDCRLAGLAQAAGATYTRYADDLAFSGGKDFARVAERFQHHACATVMEERFTVHHRKTRIMRRGVRQRLAGLVVNERPNVPRHDFDRLKATLTNCLRHGPASQNRTRHHDYRRHLEGRVAFVEMVNPNKGRRLRELFDQIEWGADQNTA